MKRTFLKLGVLSSVAAACLLSAILFAPARASERPRYGGLLRVEMRERLNSMDPRGWNPEAADAGAAERLLGLVFERLVRMNDAGQLQPALAISWQHDANFTRWQLQIRAGVKFHDGTPLNADAVVAALQAEDAARWNSSAAGAAVVLEFKSPRPNLLVELATGRSFIFRAAQDTVVGTGAFRITDWQAQKRLELKANEDDWAGRPFVDRIEIALGVSSQQQEVDLESGKVDVIELLPSLTRRASQVSGARVSASAPLELWALVIAPRGAAVYDPRFTQVLSMAIDRAAIVNVLLQRQGEPAGSLLPQWLSGYAFLFSTEANVVDAKKIRAEYSASPLQTLVYDGGDPSAALVAQRIALNARDAGINLNVSAETAAGNAANNFDVRLVRWRIAAPDAREALTTIIGRLNGAQAEAAFMPLDTPEQRYAAERAVLDRGRIIPVAFVPEIYAVGAAVKDWMPPKWGGWRLEDVWLEQTPRTGNAAAGSGTGNN
jgi:peptide/nickel transport system substrate-binding protein